MINKDFKKSITKTIDNFDFTTSELGLSLFVIDGDRSVILKSLYDSHLEQFNFQEESMTLPKLKENKKLLSTLKEMILKLEPELKL